MSETSPLPWKVNANGDLLDADGINVRRYDGPNVLLIVSAVNSHTELLAAAKRAHGAMIEWHLLDNEERDTETNKIGAAIANAEKVS